MLPSCLCRKLAEGARGGGGGRCRRKPGRVALSLQVLGDSFVMGRGPSDLKGPQLCFLELWGLQEASHGTLGKPARAPGAAALIRATLCCLLSTLVILFPRGLFTVTGGGSVGHLTAEVPHSRILCTILRGFLQ